MKDERSFDLKKLKKYIIIILFKGWKKIAIIDSITVVGFILAPYLDLDFKYSTVKITVFIILISFVIKIIIQFYKYFNYFSHKIKLHNIVEGKGSNEGQYLFVLENSIFAQKGTLLTLYTNSSKVRQPICILKVSNVIYGKEIHATQLMPTEEQTNIANMYKDDVGNGMLFASPVVSFEVIQIFGN